MGHIIKACRDNNTFRTNIQENRYIFNQIRHIQAIFNKLMSLHTKPPTPDRIGYLVKIPLQSDWYD